MNAHLEKHWTLAESMKTDLLARVAAMPEAARATPPKPGEWSPLQIISHLVVAERFVAGYASEKPDPTKRLANPFVVSLLCSVLRAGWTLPAPDVMTPDPTPQPLEPLSEEWGRDRAKLQTLLSERPPDEPFGLHPIFGVVTARQVVEMLAAHMQYHVKRFPKVNGSG